jgi:hypothetical protein
MAKKTTKKFKKEYNTVGLGDVIEKVTEATGIKTIVETVTKECNCDKRKEAMNQIRIPNLKLQRPVVRCFTDEQLIQWEAFRKLKTDVTRDQQRNIIIPIYLQLFAVQRKEVNCCLEPVINEIDKAYKIYIDE